MARKNRSPAGRVISTNTNFQLPLHLLLPRSSLLEYEDRRTWHPEGSARPARSFSSSRHRLVVQNVTPKKLFAKNVDNFAFLRKFPDQKAVIAFQAPRRVLLCVRRRIRREVLHAFGKAGKVGQRRPRFSEYSKIKC
ncbi:MAG: hypothetical protein [Arizlama microvirus]|nr:MAG: hypothetical protein [Arizlama microvirus]